MSGKPDCGPQRQVWAVQQVAAQAGPTQLAHVDGLGCGGEQAVAVGHQIGAEDDQDCDGKSQLQHTWRGQEWELPLTSHSDTGCKATATYAVTLPQARLTVASASATTPMASMLPRRCAASASAVRWWYSAMSVTGSCRAEVYGLHMRQM